MSNGLQRWAPLTALLFLVLSLVGFAIQDPPDFMDSAGEIAEYYSDDPGMVILGEYLFSLGVVAFLIFAAALRRALLAAEGEAGSLTALGFAGSIIGAAMLLAAAGQNVSGAFRADEDGAIDAATAIAHNDASYALFGLSAPLALALTVGTTALIALRTGFLPAWFGWLSAALTLALLIGPIAWIAMFGFYVWTVVAGVLIYQRAAPSQAPAA